MKMLIPQKVTLNKIYAGVHWSTRKAIVNTFHNAMLPYRNERFTTPCHLTFRFTFTRSVLDNLNTAFMAKCLEDAMCMYKIIPGDTPTYITGVTLHSTKGRADEVEITYA